jgi:hypothetical protein
MEDAMIPESPSRYACFFLTIVLAFSAAAEAQTYKYFQIFEVAHSCCLGAGKSYDGSVYEYKSDDLGDYTQWRFERADSGHYYIVDRRHGAALSSDYSSLISRVPGHLRSYNGKSNCMWKAEKATTVGAHWLKDSKYGLALVAGDQYDGHVYLQAPGERRNAQWVVQLVQAGDIGPDFYVANQQLLSLTLDTTVARNRLEVAPLFAVDQVVSNNTDVEQTTSIDVRKSETTTEKYSFTKSVKVSVAITIESSVSVRGVAEVSSTVQTTYEESYSWTTEVEKSRTSEYVWTIPVTVSPHSAVKVTGTIRKFTLSLPFTAVIRSTLGDGTTRTDTIPGTWDGVDYLTGSIQYQQITDIQNTVGGLPVEYRLYPAYPNPFNPSTIIKYELPKSSNVSLSLYDILGREVSVLVNGRKDAGVHEVKFHASGFSSGLYFYRLKAGGFVETKKLVLVR